VPADDLAGTSAFPSKSYGCLLTRNSLPVAKRRKRGMN
jgi:hypothetical protein